MPSYIWSVFHAPCAAAMGCARREDCWPDGYMRTPNIPSPWISAVINSINAEGDGLAWWGLGGDSPEDRGQDEKGLCKHRRASREDLERVLETRLSWPGHWRNGCLFPARRQVSQGLLSNISGDGCGQERGDNRVYKYKKGDTLAIIVNNIYKPDTSCVLRVCFFVFPLL